MNIPRLSAKYRSLVLLLVAMILLLGVSNYLTISRREDPEIKISIALVITIWPGKGAEDMERLVTSKLEDSIEQLDGLKELKSISRENVSMIMVDMEYDIDVDLAWQKLRNRLAEAKDELPDGVIGPNVMDDFGDVTVMIWGITSPSASYSELLTWTEELRARMQELETVDKVHILGEQEEVIYIEGTEKSFGHYGFTPLQVARVLSAQNVTIPSGYIRSDSWSYRVDTSGAFEGVEDLRKAVLDVSPTTGHPVRVEDVFSLRKAPKEPPGQMMETNGQRSLGLDLRMRQGHNVVSMGQQVKEIANQFVKELPPHIQLELLHDQPRQVDDFIKSFMTNLLQGLVVVILVMFLAMGARSTLIVAVSLPLSIVATIAVMPVLGLDLETVSIAAFIIALGMLVDNAIIITDNILHHLERGETPAKAAIDGAQELVFPVLSGTVATAVAFLPLLLLKAELGAYVRALPLVVTVSMAASFIIAMSLTPLLASSVLRAKKKKKKKLGKGGGKQQPKALTTSSDLSDVEPISHGNGYLARAYARFMAFGMRARYLILLAALASLAGALYLVPVVGLSFFPEVDRDQFTVDVWLPEGTRIEKTERVVRLVETVLLEEPEVVSYATFIGQGGPRFHITVKPEFNTPNYARFMVNTSGPMVTRPLVERLRATFQETVPGAQIKPSNLLLGIPVEAPIAIKILGPEVDRMRQISNEIQEILRSIPGTTLVRDDLGQEVRSFEVEVDSESAMMVGITSTDVALTLLVANEGLPTTVLHRGKDKIPVLLRQVREDPHNANSILQLSVPSTVTGSKVPLSALATVVPRWAQGVIRRHNNRRCVTVMSETSNRLASDIMDEAWPQIAALQLPPGYRVLSEGEEKARNSAFQELIFVFVVIVLMLILVLVLQFNSLAKALAVMFSVPLAIIGAVLGLLVSGNSFSFMAFLGVVSLAGVVIKNAVVWVEFVEQASKDGSTLEEAIIQAGIRRFRPIMLTAATTIGGLLPLALFGGVLWEGMAWAMIFGLALATVLTLVVVPIIYYIFFRKAEPNDKGDACNSGSGKGKGKAPTQDEREPAVRPEDGACAHEMAIARTSRPQPHWVLARLHPKATAQLVCVVVVLLLALVAGSGSARGQEGAKEEGEPVTPAGAAQPTPSTDQSAPPAQPAAEPTLLVAEPAPAPTAQSAPLTKPAATPTQPAGAGAGTGIPNPDHPIHDYIQTALQHSLAGRTARLMIEDAQVDRRQALASFVPIPEVRASATRLDRKHILSIDPFELPIPIELDMPEILLVDRNVFQVAGGVTIPLYVGGRRLAAKSASEHGLQARRHVVHAVDQQVEFGVVARYVQLLEVRRRRDVLERQLCADRQLVSIATQKVHSQMAVPFDISYAQTMGSDTEMDLVLIRGEEQEYLRAINELMGLPIHEPVNRQDLQFDPVFQPDGEALRQALENRPEVLALKERSAALQQSVKAAKGELLPEVALLGELGYKHGDMGYLEGRSYWQATLGVRWNLMLDAPARARVEKAEIAARKAELEVEEMLQQLESELSKAEQQFRSSQELYQVALMAQKTAQEGWQNGRKAHELGVLPLARVVDASKALAKAQNHLLRASYGRLLTEARLRVVVGLPALTSANLQVGASAEPVLPECDL